jgi:hypothetical protein
MLRRSLTVLAVLLCALGVGLVHAPSPALAAVCADYPNQAAAQAAGHARDGDGDGIYCETLPCPCSTAPPVRPAPPVTPAPPAPAPTPVPPVTTPPSTTTPATTADTTNPAGCKKPAGVQNVTFSKTKYPNIRKHFLKALRKGWPRTLVLNRAGADQRRARLLENVATKKGYDRDEYPPALARGKGIGLTKGIDPRGWKADVALVLSSENRSHGATMGTKLRRFCNGVKFRYVFY